MGSTVTIAAATIVHDAPENILDYLVRRTAATVGTIVDRADAIVVGEVLETGAHGVPIPAQDTAALRQWLSGEAGVGPRLMVHRTRVKVEEWLRGSDPSEEIQLAYVSAPRFPLFNVGARGLLFLNDVDPTLPYAAWLPLPAYQLAVGETGMHEFLAKDYDNRDQPYLRDHTAAVQLWIAAVRWYISLAAIDPEARHTQLLQALSNDNPRIVHHAIRELAQHPGHTTAEHFRNMLPSATGDVRIRLILGLWILGESETARQLLEDLFRREGKDTVLDRWGLQASTVELGQTSDVLFGPDPTEVKGD